MPDGKERSGLDIGLVSASHALNVTAGSASRASVAEAKRPNRSKRAARTVSAEQELKSQRQLRDTLRRMAPPGLFERATRTFHIDRCTFSLFLLLSYFLTFFLLCLPYKLTRPFFFRIDRTLDFEGAQQYVQGGGGLGMHGSKSSSFGVFKCGLPHGANDRAAGQNEFEKRGGDGSFSHRTAAAAAAANQSDFHKNQFSQHRVESPDRLADLVPLELTTELLELIVYGWPDLRVLYSYGCVASAPNLERFKLIWERLNPYSESKLKELDSNDRSVDVFDRSGIGTV